ncbi:Predicted branched-chain amino acid permease (azaleucine resistance) [Cognatiyoonia koreensis]|uniref:Predicted branched-chain amino acid permease (Azaleucine resistance) n=1 Tax=Cognatiyoonia koreensis TaxID=364200 RepID=A0A1I0RE08_9RHOB|nr:AzlC family ABC transporter permease [Cognatiyoonia koreensis]SEW39070.1 Predicted branched-chain amino acid permease (azaleucine resistance) [Cognatiyoonia koreensis]
MHPSTAKSAYLKGIRDGSPFLVMAIPFALVFGVVATEAGLTLGQTLGFSVLVIAGASQYAALQLMVENAAIVLVLMAALAVNLRMAMYSASLVPHLGAAPLWQRALVAYVNFDQSYIVSIAQYEKAPDWSVRDKALFFLGVATPIAPAWMCSTAVGALVGAQIPPEYALDFIVPIMFLAMVAPMLKSLAHVLAALVSATVALLLIGLPSGVGLLIAAGAAMLTGALVETWLEQRT